MITVAIVLFTFAALANTLLLWMEHRSIADRERGPAEFGPSRRTGHTARSPPWPRQDVAGADGR